MSRSEARPLIHQLARPEGRDAAAHALAGYLGVERLAIYVRDPELEVMLPAAGTVKTVQGGPLWRQFLRRCLTERRPEALVDLAAGPPQHAFAVCEDGAAFILVGGNPDRDRVDELASELPLLSAVLSAQQALALERASAAEARDAASRAHALTQALDAARSSSAELNLQLQREHARKDEFLAMLAHELRNPLATLHNSVEILRRSPHAGERDITRPIGMMARQLSHLTRLVDDLLDVSRVSRGTIQLQRETLLLQEILDEAVEAVGPLMEERGIVLQRSGGDAAIFVNGDRTRLSQVFVNLLINAVRFSDPGGRISLAVVPDERRVSVVLQDNGVGIPQHMLGRVFDMFIQVPANRGRAQGGLGIGLTLVRRLVELHGGRVTAYSRGEGHGSTLTVSLAQVAPRPGRRRGQAEAAPGTLLPGASPRVLLVEDNEDAAQSLAEVLQCLGAQPMLARDGEEALQCARDLAPDLVLLDIGLPGIDGYETARRLRQLQPGGPRLVALTGYGSEADRRRALEAGFDEHCVKPLTAQEAARLLQGASGLRRQA